MPITAKTYTTEVICLRTIDFGEADKILHLYSPEYGRISAIAKSVKKPNSKLAGACELLNLSEVQLSRGKNLDLLIQYQPRETFVGIRSDLLKVAYAMLFAELINLFTVDADMDSRQLFGLLKESLQGLDAAPETAVIPQALVFQMTLLEATGYRPILDACVFTGETLDMQAVYYSFSPQLGGITTPERKRAQQPEGASGVHWVNISSGTLRILNQAAQGLSVEAGPEGLIKAQKFLRYYLRQVLEKDARSFSLLMSMLEPGMMGISGGAVPDTAV